MSTTWSVSFDVLPSNAITRADVAASIDLLCESLFICFQTRSNLSTPALSSLASFVTCNSKRLARSYDTTRVTVALKLHRLAYADSIMNMLKRSVVYSAATGLVVSALMDFESAVAELSQYDLDAEMKNVAAEALHWRMRLWYLIAYENMTRLDEMHPAITEMEKRHVGLKRTFQSLLMRHRIAQNLGNPKRLRFTDHLMLTSAIDGDGSSNVKWANDVLDWFAERLNPPSYNRRSLYLYGPAGVGKTRFIQRLVEGYECFRRDAGEVFFLQGLTERHDFVWLDEFVPEVLVKRCDTRTQFNQLAGRERISVRVKSGNQYEVDASAIRTIVCSNDPLPQNDYFRRRFVIILAEEQLYQQEQHHPSTVVKVLSCSNH